MSPILPSGSFIGKLERTVEAEGFSFREVVDRSEEEIPLHTHEEAHFIFVVQGAYITSARGVDPLCSSPTLLFNPAGTTHRDRFQTRGGRFLAVSIGPERLRRVQDQAGLADHAVGFSRGTIPWLASRLYEELRAMDGLSPLVMEGIALELLGHAARQQMRPGRRPPGWLRRAHDLIHDRFPGPVTVAEIAQAAGVHPVHLSRTFREHYRMTVGEYLRKLRVEHACRQLSTTDAPLSEIALAAGFCDQSHFSRTFKRVTGTTPAEYRRLV